MDDRIKIKRIIEEIFQEQSHKQDELEKSHEDLADSEVREELECLVRSIRENEKKLDPFMNRKASVRAEYVIDMVRQESKKQGLIAKLTLFFNQLNDKFWGWVIKRFDLLSDRDIVLANQNYPMKWNSLFSGIFPALLFLVCIMTAVYLYNEISGPQTPQKINLISTPVKIESTTSKPRSFMFTKSVQVSMAQETLFEKISDRKINLKKGNVWLDVEKEGVGFEVNTKWGPVLVTGTSFGVKKMGNHLQVDVAEGEVVLPSLSGRYVARAGQTAIITIDQSPQIHSREIGLVKPIWAQFTSPEYDLHQVERAELNPHELGFSLKGGNEEIVLLELKQPVEGKAVFQVQNQILQDAKLVGDELVGFNAFFVCGESPEAAALLKCGVFARATDNAIYHGLTDNVQSNELARSKYFYQSINELRTSTITIDLSTRTIQMASNGKTLTAKIPDSIQQIRYIGYCNANSIVAFGPIERIE